MSFIITDDSINKDIASAIREVAEIEEQMPVTDFVPNISNIPCSASSADLIDVKINNCGFNTSKYAKLIDELPAVRNIPLQDNKGELYLTVINDMSIFPLSVDRAVVSFVLGLRSAKTCKMKVGYYNDGQFIPLNDTEYTITHNKDFTYVSTYPGELLRYLILYIYTDEGDDINFFQFAAHKVDDVHMFRNMNPVIERYGHVYDYGAAGEGWGTVFLVREKVNRQALGNNSMYRLWMNCYSLVDLDVSEWDTGMWNNTTLCETWNNCHSLEELDLSNWDVSNWSMNATNTLASTWQNCFNLKRINFGNWNTKRWAVRALLTTFNACNSLKELDLSGWDVSNWKVETLTSTWNECTSLELLNVSTWDTSGWIVARLNNTWRMCNMIKELDLSNFDTHNWAVAEFNSCWAYDYSLVKLDIGTWDTSNWKVTTIANTWYQCNSLAYIDIGRWDTSKWVVDSLSSTWYNCTALSELNISNWITNGWKVVSMASTWSGCSSLIKLDLSNWDTSRWVNRTLASTWYGCISLSELSISTWDTSKWAVNSLYYAWANCMSLKSIDLSRWDTSNWEVATIVAIWQGCVSITKVGTCNWNTSNWVVSNMVSALQNCLSLKEFPFANWDTRKWSIAALTNSFRFIWFKTIDISFLNCNTIITSFLGVSNGSSYLQFGMDVTGVTTTFICGEHNYGKYLPSDSVIWVNEASLNRASIIELFKFLAPVVGAAKTIKFRVAVAGLTEADIRIATDKGYTIEGALPVSTQSLLNNDDPITEEELI